MNKISIIGTLTAQPETKYTTSGTAITSFSVAWNESRKQQDGSYKDEVHFFQVTAWAKKGEVIQQHFGKGSRIAIIGRLQQDRWEKDGQKHSKVYVTLEDFDFIDRKQDAQPQEDRGYSNPSPQYAPPQQNQPSNVPEIDITEIPF